MRNKIENEKLILAILFFFSLVCLSNIIQLLDRDPTPDDPISIILLAVIITGVVGIGIVLFFLRKMKRARLDEKKAKIIQEHRALNVQVTEEEVTISEEKKICLVCKGKVLRFSYICECGANYCGHCAQALTNLENVCWACEVPIDYSKPVKQLKEEERVKVEVQEKARKK